MLYPLSSDNVFMNFKPVSISGAVPADGLQSGVLEFFLPPLATRLPTFPGLCLELNTIERQGPQG